MSEVDDDEDDEIASVPTQARSREVADDKLDRLLVLIERLCQDLERGLAQGRDNAIRAARKAGPTTPAAMEAVAKRLKRIGGKK